MTDCNLNGIHDTVEVANLQAVDADDNGVPDECQVVSALAPPSPHQIRKNRFISFDPGNPFAPVAFKISLLDLACSATTRKCSTESDCKACVGGDQNGNGCAKNSQCAGGACEVSGESCDEQSVPVFLGWVSEPAQAGGDAPVDTPTASVEAAQPAFRVWTEPVVHVGDCEIAPVRTYGITAVSAAAESAMLVVSTIEKPEVKFWGDIVGSFNGTEWTPPNGLVNVDGVTGLIKFITLKPAPHITVTDVAGSGPSFVNFIVNSTDLFLIIQAFLGKTYPPLPFLVEGYPADGDLTLCP